MSADSTDKAADSIKETSRGTSETTVREADSGKFDLVKKQKEHIESLKAGGRSGITNQFGKLYLTSESSASKQSEDQLKSSIESVVRASYEMLGKAPSGENKADAGAAGGQYDKVTRHVRDGAVTSIDWEDAKGNKTILNVDDHGKVTGGQMRDWNGNEVAQVTVIGGDKLVYDDGQTKRLVEFHVDRTRGIRTHELGTYDPDTGTIFQQKEGYGQRESLSPGRKEIISPNGDLQSTTDRGDYGLLVKATGDAMVSHADSTGAFLRADGTIDMWHGKEHVKEKLSTEEQRYLKKHPDIDRRDVAEIHRRFYPDHDKIDAFYRSLEKLDTAKNLSNDEKSALRRELMHHVAAPEDIYQGTTESCNVSVVERDLAMTNPKKYVDTVREAISNGVVHTADGDVKVDPMNLKMADSSGRDLASRIFQTAALHAEFWPTKNFENTPDGIGRLRPGDARHNKGSDKDVVFTGLLPAEVAEIRYKLTGEQKAIALINNADDLKQAVEKNGVPMTIAVDANAAPFNGSPPADHRPNHVVTIVGVLENPRRYLVQNQWGLEKDLSTPEKAVSEETLVKNMTGSGSVAGEALVPGDHSKLIANGKVVSNFEYLKEEKEKRYKHELGSNR